MMYKAKALLMPLITRTFITKVNKLLFKFIWSSNREKVSRNVLCNNIES